MWDVTRAESRPLVALHFAECPDKNPRLMHSQSLVTTENVSRGIFMVLCTLCSSLFLFMEKRKRKESCIAKV